MKNNFALMLALAIGLMAGLVMPAAAQSERQFNQKQRDEIGQIVREYMLENPELLREIISELEQREQLAQTEAARDAIAQNGPAIYKAEGDLIAGNPNGSVTMVEFFDYNCGFCKRSLPEILTLIENDKDLRVVMKEFPILGPGSTYASRAAVASANQGKYWELHLALMQHQSTVDENTVNQIAEDLGLDMPKLIADMQSSEIETMLEGNIRLAQELGIQGTPAFIIDQTLVPGAVGMAELAAAVKQVRETGGCKIC